MRPRSAGGLPCGGGRMAEKERTEDRLSHDRHRLLRHEAHGLRGLLSHRRAVWHHLPWRTPDGWHAVFRL